MSACLKNNRGSFTIEAAVIISFIVLVIAAILQLTFFLYDKCSLERAAAVGALRGSEAVWEDQNTRYQRADEGIHAVFENNLLGTDEVKKQIEVTGNEIKVVLEMQFRWWGCRISSEKKALNPVTFIRNCRKAKGIMEKE